MLTAIRIGNFKAFAEEQRIPIRPLTLLYGANSSGKSSVLHSLVLARHALETGKLDVHRTQIGGESVDLGGFRQYVHRRDANRRMEWAIELDTGAFQGRMAELFAPVRLVTARVEIGVVHTEKMRKRPGIDSRTDKPIMIEEPTGEVVPVGDPTIQAFSLECDGKPLLRMSRRPAGVFQLDSLDHENPVLRGVVRAIIETSTTTEAVHPSDFEGLDEAVSAIVPNIVASSGRLLPFGIVKPEGSGPGASQTLFPISKGRRKEDLAAAVNFFLPRTIDEILKSMHSAVSNELMQFQYLGPLRSYPPRHLAFSQDQDPNLHAGGGYAWDVVRRDANVRKLVNEWLSAPDRLHTKYELKIRHLLTVDDLEADYAKNIEKIEERFTSDGPYDWDLFGEIYSTLGKIKEKDADLTDLQELNFIDKRSETIVSHRDVGIGVSQVLPVLVCAFASRGQIVAIEQPEIHLHPALQADLGDVFIQSALGEGKNRFLIETHSEHLLLRIMRRMRETSNHKLPEGVSPVTPKDVSVLYIEPDGSRSIVREMALNEAGELVKAWPGGFFEEGLREVF